MFLKCFKYQCFVWPSLGPNCLQRLSADDTKRQRVNIPHYTSYLLQLLCLLMVLYTSFTLYSLLLCHLISSTVLSQLLLSLLIPLYTSFPSIPCCCSVVLSPLLYFPSCFFLFSFPSTLLSLLYPAAALSSYLLYCTFPVASFSSRSPLHFFPFYTLLLLCHLISSTVLSQLLLSLLVTLYPSFPSIHCCCFVVLSLLFYPSCFFLFSLPFTLLSLLYPAASFSSRSPVHIFPFYTLLLLCCLIPSSVLFQLLLSLLVPLYPSFPSIPCCCSVVLSLLFFPSCFFL